MRSNVLSYLTDANKRKKGAPQYWNVFIFQPKHSYADRHVTRNVSALSMEIKQEDLTGMSVSNMSLISAHNIIRALPPKVPFHTRHAFKYLNGGYIYSLDNSLRLKLQTNLEEVHNTWNWILYNSILQPWWDYWASVHCTSSRFESISSRLIFRLKQGSVGCLFVTLCLGDAIASISFVRKGST